MNAKCAQMQKDAAFSCTSIKQKFQVEIIKLPKEVKKMSLARFREEFGDDIENVLKNTISRNNDKGRTTSSKTAKIASAVDGSGVFKRPPVKIIDLLR